MPVLVTGGAGFIGSWLVEELVNYGALVTVLDDCSTGCYENLSAVNTRIKFIQGSITDNASLHAALKGQKIVFHLAGATSIEESFCNPEKYHAINATAMLALLQLCRQHNIERFIFASSVAVYGNTATMQNKLSETNVCAPISPYGLSKYIAEQYCMLYSYCYALTTVILRYCNVYGERQNAIRDNGSVAARFTECLRTNMPLVLFGDGTQTRDFISVHEVVTATICLAVLAPTISGQCFNIGTGNSITLLELVQQLKQKFPYSTSTLTFAAERPGDIKHFTADCSKYKHILSYLLANSE